jgi:hypothetical protein
MEKERQKSRIDEADKELAKRVARRVIMMALIGVEEIADKLKDLIEALELAWPEDEIKDGSQRPAEYSTAVNLRGRMMQVIRHANKLLNK